MNAAAELRLHTVANEALMTACCLFVLDSRFGEMQMSYRVADHADPGRLGDVAGKYVKRAPGYVRIGEDGTASALGELPDGVASEDVVVDELDVSSATPLGDRLRAIAHSLRTGAEQDAGAEALADAIEASLEASRPGDAERRSAQIRQRAQSEVFDADGPGDASDMAERARRFLDYLGELAHELQDGPLGDGNTIGGVLAIRALLLARAARAQNPEDEADALIESLLYVTAPGAARIEQVAMGLCSRMVRHGEGDIVREAAESVKAEGDALIDRALDGDLLTFHASLYPAAAYELAAVHMGRAAAEASGDAGERKRWARLAVNAEERAVRVATSLGLAVMNLDGAWIARHQLALRRTRQEEGDDAAKLEAQDLIVNQLFYPRAMMPILLSEAPPTGDRVEQP
jgi:hypothetical protein